MASDVMKSSENGDEPQMSRNCSFPVTTAGEVTSVVGETDTEF